MSGAPAFTAGWLPPSVRNVAAGRGAPSKSARIAVACKKCKKAKAKCDMSRPCRRCLYKGVQDECTADDSDLPQGSSAAQISPPALMQSPSSFSSSSLPSCESAASDTAGRGGGAGGSAYHRAEVGDLTAEESPKKGADGEECFEISLPELQVLSAQLSRAATQHHTEAQQGAVFFCGFMTKTNMRL